MKQHGSSHCTSVDPHPLYSHCSLSYLFFLIFPSLYTCSSGSHIENWHSVLRNGLVNASYTKLQVRNPGSWLGFMMHLLSDSKPALGQSRLAVRLIHFCSKWMPASLFVSFAIDILASRAHWEIFLANVGHFFSFVLSPLPAAADSMCPHVEGHMEGAVVSAVVSGRCLCALLGLTT